MDQATHADVLHLLFHGGLVMSIKLFVLHPLHPSLHPPLHQLALPRSWRSARGCPAIALGSSAARSCRPRFHVPLHDCFPHLFPFLFLLPPPFCLFSLLTLPLTTLLFPFSSPPLSVSYVAGLHLANASAQSHSLVPSALGHTTSPIYFLHAHQWALHHQPWLFPLTPTSSSQSCKKNCKASVCRNERVDARQLCTHAAACIGRPKSICHGWQAQKDWQPPYLGVLFSVVFGRLCLRHESEGAGHLWSGDCSPSSKTWGQWMASVRLSLLSAVHCWCQSPLGRALPLSNGSHGVGTHPAIQTKANLASWVMVGSQPEHLRPTYSRDQETLHQGRAVQIFGAIASYKLTCASSPTLLLCKTPHPLSSCPHIRVFKLFSETTSVPQLRLTFIWHY